MNRAVIADEQTTAIPSISPKDEHTFNRQTAYNRSLIEHANVCGCFHCGSTFDSSRVHEWIAESDGEDTALCPYCKTDAIIVGNEKFPLSTALLSELYMTWFEDEYKEKVKVATRMPTHENHDDFLRKGVPFLYEEDESIKVLGEIGLFGLNCEGSAWRSALPPDKQKAQTTSKGFGGVVNIAPFFLQNGYFCARFITEDGKIFPREPWSGQDMDLLEDLVNQYGSRLKGLVKNGGAMQLYVQEK